MSSPLAAHAPSRREGMVLLLVLGGLTAFGPMSIDMYLPSLPTIQRELGGSAAMGQATVAAFLTGIAAGQLVYGPWSDRVGRRKPLILGLAIFLVASAGCALATSFPLLILARVCQALGGCAGMVVARAVVRDRFDHRQSARIFSILMLIMGVAPILAPLAGGWLLAAAGWRSIFWALLGFGAVTGAAVLVFLPETRSPATEARARSEHPFRAYAALFAQPEVLGYVLTGAFISAAMFAYIAASPEVVIVVFGIPPTRFGWVFGANAVGIIGASQLNRLLLRRMHPDRILRICTLVVSASALALLFDALTGFGGLWGVLVPLFFAISGQGWGTPNALAGALSVDQTRAGSLSALFGTAQFALGALAQAFTGFLHDGTARPMAWVVAACTVGAALSLRLAPHRRAGPV